MSDNRDEIVKAFPGRDRWSKRRVLKVKRSDGYYAIRSEQWIEEAYDGRIIFADWVPMDGRFGIFESISLAEKEVQVYYSWLCQLVPD